MSTNRTKWPVTGGAIGIQPGWFQGHLNALFYINLGDGTVPGNYSLIMQPMFGIVGPHNSAYNGSFCLPQVSLPANYTAVIGTNATIQIIEAAQHGAALYNVSCWELSEHAWMRWLSEQAADSLAKQCVDITFADPKDVEAVTPDNCANTSDITLQYVYSTNSQTSDAEVLLPSKVTWMASMPLALMVVWGLL